MSEQFQQLLESYYQAWFRFHPEAAVEIGVPGYSGLLTPFSDDDFGALLALHEKLLSSLEELDIDALSEEERVDMEVISGAAFLEMESMMTLDWRRRDPQRYLPLNAIYQLTVREVDNLAQALEQRLRAVPAYMRNARQSLAQQPERIPPLWLDLAVTSARAGSDFLRGLAQHPTVKPLARQIRDLDVLLHDAAGAVTAFGRFLEEEIGTRATGDFACGAQRFQHLLRYRHFLDIPADALHALGMRLFEQTERDLKSACRDLGGNEDVLDMARRIQIDTPVGDSLLEEYESGMRAAREFVLKHDLVTFPEHEHLSVEPTPVFMRHQIPFAAYMEPARDDPRQRGIYYVTPPQTAEALAEHSRPGLQLTCVHEAYPGHHLQFTTANGSTTSSSLPRLINTSATLFEGWALYCEQLMLEQGFLSRPEHRFLMLKDRLWRALRILIDVEIQTRGLTIDQAAARMQSALGFPREQALADLAWYTQAPTTPMGYAAGWAMINAARDRLRAVRPEISLREFHDGLLSGGSIALTQVLRRAFGADIETSARNMVFGTSAT